MSNNHYRSWYWPFGSRKPRKNNDPVLTAGPSIQVHVQNMAGDVLTFHIPARSTVETLKKYVHNENPDAKISWQKLMIPNHEGNPTVLLNKNTLESYGISNDSTILIFIEEPIEEKYMFNVKYEEPNVPQLPVEDIDHAFEVFETGRAWVDFGSEKSTFDRLEYAFMGKTLNHPSVLKRNVEYIYYLKNNNVEIDLYNPPYITEHLKVEGRIINISIRYNMAMLRGVDGRYYAGPFDKIIHNFNRGGRIKHRTRKYRNLKKNKTNRRKARR